MFSLYFGVVLLRDTLAPEKYQHFLNLHVAVTILLGPVLCAIQELRAYARDLLRNFVENTPLLYSRRYMAVAWHALQHIDCYAI